MGYKLLKEETIPRIEGQRIGNKKYLFKNVILKLTEKELIFTEKSRTYKYTIRLPAIYRLKLHRKKENGEIKYRIQVNDFMFYGNPEWFYLINAKINAS